MRSFKTFFLEYRHNTADGMPKASIKPTNGKDINRIGNGKRLYDKGPYKPKDDMAHRPGTILMGDQLTSMLLDYNLEFKDGQTSQIKNSPHALEFFMNGQNQASARVVATK